MDKVRVSKCSLLAIALGKKSVSSNLNEKNDFEVFLNLARYRSKNNFVGLSK